MPIEFRCTQCQRLLRTQDDSAGKQAKCPECGTIMVVPAPEADEANVPLPPLPTSRLGNPFGSGGTSPFATRPADGGDRTGGQNPYQSPTDYAAPPIGAGPRGPIIPTTIDLGDILSRTWRIFTQQWGLCLGLTLVFGFIVIGTQLLVETVIAALAGGNNPELSFTIAITVFLAQGLLWMWLGIGYNLALLRLARGEPTSMGELFNGGSYMVSILLGSIVFNIAFFLGYLFFIIPGIIVALMFSQFYYLILDRRIGVLESFSISQKVMIGNKLTLFALVLVVGLLGGLFALVTCFVGLVAVAPFFSLMLAVTYLVVTGQPTADGSYRST